MTCCTVPALPIICTLKVPRGVLALVDNVSSDVAGQGGIYAAGSTPLITILRRMAFATAAAGFIHRRSFNGFCEWAFGRVSRWKTGIRTSV